MSGCTGACHSGGGCTCTGPAPLSVQERAQFPREVVLEHDLAVALAENKKESTMYVNPSPAERLILENQQVIMRGLRAALFAIGGNVTRLAAVAIEDQMGRSQKGLTP